MAAFYRATLFDFIRQSSDEILGCLLRSYQHNELQKRQTKAWGVEIKVLNSAFTELIRLYPHARDWSLLLEYPIPRRSKRLDGVILMSDIIVCLEFKTEDKSYALQSKRQVEDYALDLRDFHEVSRDRTIVPVVVVPRAPSDSSCVAVPTEDTVLGVQLANEANLAKVLLSIFEHCHSTERKPIDASAWNESAYRPIPTIIEAAEMLYAEHNVLELTHSYAGKVNLVATTNRLVEIIEQAQRLNEKIVCIVTGVPGAGKTLAGLNVVHNPTLRCDGRPAGIFLSGNGPLVRIVRGAIARDHKRRKKERGGERVATTFIQNIHDFVRLGLEKPDKLPAERVVVYDEAQRAWNAIQNQKKGRGDVSEPETMLSILDRYKDWAVLIALVGGGQEINDGEAGLAEWGNTLREKFPHWIVAVSPKALDRDVSVAGHRLFENGERGSLKIRVEPSLHLEVSERSYRARRLTEWVEAVLSREPEKASAIVADLGDFPMGLTRSLSAARQWLQHRTRGQRRCGLVASSGGLRLRAEGLEMSSSFRLGNRDLFVHWFLDQPPDIRSSNQLEIAASEFDCQGLELDWVGVCWEGDLTFNVATNDWVYRNFSGNSWKNTRQATAQNYLLNTYRVLLTRARQGMIIWVPEGNAKDETRMPSWFDSNAAYLQSCGLQLICRALA